MEAAPPAVIFDISALLKSIQAPPENLLFCGSLISHLATEKYRCSSVCCDITVGCGYSCIRAHF